MKQIVLLKATLQNPVRVNQILVSGTVVEQVNIEGGAQESSHFTNWKRMRKNSTVKFFSMLCSVIAVRNYARVSTSVEYKVLQ